MSQRTATITSLPMAFEIVKAMQADGLDWGEGYRPLGRQALAEIIEGQMAAAVERHLDRLDADDAADRRNGGSPGGDVRGSVSGEEGGTPTVAAKHTTEHPPCHSELRRLRVYRWRLKS